jgi:hypothetical protein
MADPSQRCLLPAARRDPKFADLTLGKSGEAPSNFLKPSQKNFERLTWPYIASTTSSVVSIDFSTVMTPSFIASEMMLPTCLSVLALMVPTLRDHVTFHIMASTQPSVG